ncbi:DNA repair protein RecN [Echinicola vietnamensis]|uniref:DNA repair protein RecN n=1 Tax=Echinicola vietnamensis (strain DSM 17526 / LMG 23754 / KMM 6221) TaxID=926556 RepID=L0FWN1_ECHVK|nr:DNA repair protein RecN [Echinicola vietnamensis]AGA78319.1 DNA repair protein RecN [Echinicola vietnamensis DSM 17526]
MLKNLSITNYALIETLEMGPSKGLNMITGETGAGKSIMLGAIGLLLGNRADTKALFNDEKKCIIEGVFEIANYGLEAYFQAEDLDYDPQCIIRREITPAGKSRAFVNDTPVKLDILKSLGKALMDIHSQHDTLLLAAGEYQLSLIDAFADTKTEKTQYSTAYTAYRKAKKSYEKLVHEAAELRKEADFNQFQLEELSALQLQEGEQETLENEQEVLDNAEEIKSKINENLQLFNGDELGATTLLMQINQGFQQLGRYSSRFDELKERFDSVCIEVNDIAASLEDEDGKIEVDFDKLEEIRERLSKIYQLQKKHGVQTVEELIALEKTLADKAFQIGNLDEELEQLKAEMDQTWEILSQTGAKLSQKRQRHFKGFAEEITGLLAHLGMENANIEISHRTTDPTPSGKDEVEILFTANKGVKPQPIRQVASGGEFSRLMFAIKYIMADKVALPTLIFDEIDTGISGEVALQMVQMMQEIAKRHQVICISHLPQVAAKGEKHYFVYKDNSAAKTMSKIRALNQEERVTEIAKMIAGANPSESAVKSAMDLLGK